jgi:hypothetical protein
VDIINWFHVDVDQEQIQILFTRCYVISGSIFENNNGSGTSIGDGSVQQSEPAMASAPGKVLLFESNHLELCHIQIQILFKWCFVICGSIFENSIRQ